MPAHPFPLACRRALFPARRWLGSWITLSLLALLLTSGCGEDATDQGVGLSDERSPGIPEAADGEPLELEWDHLMPADWEPERFLAKIDADHLSDEDPRAQALMRKLEARWADAPLVEALDGRQVRLSGLVLPLASEATTVREFLLVPYFGACIHVPPPPANQTILVRAPAGQPSAGALFDTVWVEGRLQVMPSQHELGTAGYRIDNARVRLYQEL
ncbi:DUF3299 domain-containing protein [Halochromatium glycolicum]|uniref:DUF3299 domain-containing protein n=1 Tax=Halochromatium glycolicum TaxID=85075 RepID=A0AAJ0U428_9GAMM|nr:DUF3299 domain-containing protein [Halochromatium glycolicum]MBK1704442.1 hypothetical protein [Halochromatium glycolicum]